MQIKVSSPGNELRDSDVDRIQKDLEKIDRRLSSYDEVYAEVRITGNHAAPTQRVTIELEYGRHHLIAKADGTDMAQVVRAAREDILRQINDRSRRGHSSFAKRR